MKRGLSVANSNSNKDLVSSHIPHQNSTKDFKKNILAIGFHTSYKNTSEFRNSIKERGVISVRRETVTPLGIISYTNHPGMLHQKSQE